MKHISDMKQHILLILLCLTAAAAVAQPPARRTQQQQERQSATPQPSAYRDFPTAQAMPTDAAWRRDIFRQLDLTKDANAVLYYPTTPQDGRVNLFTYLFRLILRGQIKAYEYTLDMNPHFTEEHQIKGKSIMDAYRIPYESKDGRMRVNDADLPSEEVKLYYIKESRYYDQHTASFRTRVAAICPVLQRGDFDFGGAESRQPMFWVDYNEAAPHLGKLMLMSSNLNNAAMMSADDYFTLGAYDGEIYKTTNLQDRILVGDFDNDTTVRKERRRIEREITDFQDHVWGHDSVAQAKAAAEKALADSLSAAGKSAKRTSRTAPRRTAPRSASASSGTTASAAPTQEATKPKTAKVAQKRQRTSTSSRSGGTLSVRRERH